jgi:hypothetical protein
MTKYQEYFGRMLEENKKAFDEFKALHANYGMDEENYQDEFNKEGEKILKIVNEWENKLCSQSEKAGYSNYTGNLSEKFQGLLRSTFPLIDHIGIVSIRSTFKIKKLL